GRTRNELHKSESLRASLTSGNLDGNIDIKDFNIMTQNTENAVNKYSLLQAERLFGNGDGIFTVAEQQNLFGTQYERSNGPAEFRTSHQNLRFGLELNF